jgi:alpha-1,6-mannosyltransferase
MRLVVPSDEDRVEDQGEFARIYHVKAPRSPVFDRRYRMILPHTFLLPSARRLRHILWAEHPDLVEICDKYSLCWLAGALRRGWISGVPRPALVGLSCERLDDNVRTYIAAPTGALGLAGVYLRKAYVPLFDFHIAVSRYVAEELMVACAEAGRMLRVIPMGVHTDRLGPQHRDPELRLRFQKAAGGAAETRLLLYAGRLSREKNLELLVKMMEELLDAAQCRSAGKTGGGSPDCRLLVAGSGPLEGWLRQQSAKMRGRLHLLGHLGNRAELARILASVDVFVHPNPSEPFGIGPLEAMASGTPLVAPATGGVLEYADHTCAWLAQPQGAALPAEPSLLAPPVRVPYLYKETVLLRVVDGSFGKVPIFPQFQNFHRFVLVSRASRSWK